MKIFEKIEKTILGACERKTAVPCKTSHKRGNNITFLFLLHSTFSNALIVASSKHSGEPSPAEQSRSPIPALRYLRYLSTCASTLEKDDGIL